MKALIRSTHLPKLASQAACIALALICAGPSLASNRDETHQVVVHFGDLNLSNPQGAETLYRRIATAAVEVCDAFPMDSRALGSRTAIDACVKKALSDAVTKVGRPELFAVYNAKNRAPLGSPVAAIQPR